MSISGEIKEVVEQVVKSLPPGFLALCTINTIFMITLVWFMHDLAIARMEAVIKLVDTCTRALTH